MARGVNKVILIGNVGQDPEVKYMPSGGAVTNISVATSESWKDKNTGQMQERTEWHRVVIFGHGDSDGLAGIAEKFLKKGSKVYLEGALQTRKWTDQAGVEKWTTEVVLQGFAANLTLLDGKNGEAGGGNRPPPANSPDEYGRTSGRDSGGDRQAATSTDDIPF